MRDNLKSQTLEKQHLETSLQGCRSELTELELTIRSRSGDVEVLMKDISLKEERLRSLESSVAEVADLYTVVPLLKDTL